MRNGPRMVLHAPRSTEGSKASPHSSSKPISVLQLVETGILNHEWLTWNLSTDQLEKLDATLANENGRSDERRATTFLTLLTGETEKTVVAQFCGAAGIAYRPSYRLISGSNFNAAPFQPKRTRREQRSIDFVVVDIADSDGNYMDDGALHEPVIAVEAKFSAMVNGRYGYCPDLPALDYSNQIICYPHGCVNERVSVERGVKFVWLGLPLKGNKAGPLWGRRGLVESDSGATLTAAYARQQSSNELWAPLEWGTLYAALERQLVSEHGTLTSEAVLRAAGADPDRRRVSTEATPLG